MLFYCCVGFVFALAAIHRFRHPLSPLIDPDILGYLNPAISLLTGNGFTHTEGRYFLYPGFVYVILRFFDDFRAITIVQHGLGMGAGAILLLCFHRARVLIGAGFVPAAIYRWLGLIAAAIYMLSNSPILFESRIRPEAIFPFFAILNILLTIEFVRRRFSETENRGALWFGAALIFNTAITFTIKPSFGVTTFVATLPVLLSLFRSGESLRRKCATIATPAILVFLLLLAPEKHWSRHDPTSRRFAPETLFVIHANLIADQMAKDIADNTPGPYELEWLRETHAAFRQEIEASKAIKTWSTFDFNPDYLMYRHSICEQLQKQFAAHPEKLCEFYNYYYLRTLTHNPRGMGKKILNQLALFYSPPCQAYAFEAVRVADYYQKISEPGYALCLEKLNLLDSGMNFVAQMTSLRKTRDQVLEPTVMRRTRLILGNTYLPILLLCLGAGILILSSSDLRSRFYQSGLLTLLFFGYNFGNCITAAVVHTLAVRRYSVVQLIFTLFAQGMGLLFLLGIGIYLFQQWRRSSPRWNPDSAEEI